LNFGFIKEAINSKKCSKWEESPPVELEAKDRPKRQASTRSTDVHQQTLQKIVHILHSMQVQGKEPVYFSKYTYLNPKVLPPPLLKLGFRFRNRIYWGWGGVLHIPTGALLQSQQPK
jgi:hypothetical protein